MCEPGTPECFAYVRSATRQADIPRPIRRREKKRKDNIGGRDRLRSRSKAARPKRAPGEENARSGMQIAREQHQRVLTTTVPNPNESKRSHSLIDARLFRRLTNCMTQVENGNTRRTRAERLPPIGSAMMASRIQSALISAIAHRTAAERPTSQPSWPACRGSGTRGQSHRDQDAKSERVLAGSRVA